VEAGVQTSLCVLGEEVGPAVGVGVAPVEELVGLEVDALAGLVDGEVAAVEDVDGQGWPVGGWVAWYPVDDEEWCGGGEAEPELLEDFPPGGVMGCFVVVGGAAGELPAGGPVGGLDEQDVVAVVVEGAGGCDVSGGSAVVGAGG
jgi:hypothetical protein